MDAKYFEGNVLGGLNLLNRAIEIATRAHAGQVDKAGAPYILHPLRVMLSRENELERICAVLHDVVEDSDISFDDLRKEGFSEELIIVLDCLTKRKGESLGDHNPRRHQKFNRNKLDGNHTNN